MQSLPPLSRRSEPRTGTRLLPNRLRALRHRVVDEDVAPCEGRSRGLKARAPSWSGARAREASPAFSPLVPPRQESRFSAKDHPLNGREADQHHEEPEHGSAENLNLNRSWRGPFRTVPLSEHPCVDPERPKGDEDPKEHGDSPSLDLVPPLLDPLALAEASNRVVAAG
jgi:hypothetical protein